MGEGHSTVTLLCVLLSTEHGGSGQLHTMTDTRYFYIYENQRWNPLSGKTWLTQRMLGYDDGGLRFVHLRRGRINERPDQVISGNVCSAKFGLFREN